MKFELESYHRNVSSEELIKDVKRVAKQLKKQTVTMSDYEVHGQYHPSTLQRRFGSWFTVLDKAELEHSRSRLNISDEELFQNIEKIWISLGRQPKYVEVKKPLSLFSAGTYDKRFGSWGKALKKFVEYVNEDFHDEKNDINLPLITNDKPQKEKRSPKKKTKREISERLRFRILMRDGFTCKKCGRSPVKELGVELHVDHIQPWSKGGETTEKNLETKCKKCNLGKGNVFDV